MWADSEDELVLFAKSIGLKPEWIQREALIHFDLTASKRKQAVAKGAIEASDREMVAAMERQRR